MKKDDVEIFLDSIYSYEDYREFIKKYFDIKKKVMRSFTRRHFADKAGFSSHSFCNYIIKGERNLSHKSMQKFIRGLDLRGTRAKYFELLVLFNQSDDPQDEEKYYNELQKIRKKVTIKSLDQQYADYFIHRYHSIVRELVVYSNWNGDYAKLADMVIPPITTTQAKESVKMMTTLGMLEYVDGKYEFVNANIDGNKIPLFAKKKSRREVFEHTLNSLDSMSADKRFLSYTTFCTDRTSYQKINELYRKFKEEVITIVNNSKEHNEVFQITFGNIPVSKQKERK